MNYPEIYTVILINSWYTLVLLVLNDTHVSPAYLWSRYILYAEDIK